MSEPLLNIDQTTAPRRPRRLVKKSTSLSPSGKLPLWALLVGISVLILVLAPFILTLYCSVNGSLFIAQDRRQSGLYGCDATGQVFVRRAGINSLSRQYAFAITLGFGRFGFGLAKAIDVCWDLLVGRGGQALLAISTYRIFRRTMLTKRGVCILSYDKFIALTYAPDTVYALNTYLRDLRRASSSKSRAYGPSVALIICTAYILVFPTWTSAMTGYQAYTIPYIASSSSDERLTRMNELEPCDWILGHNYTMAIERFCMVKNSSIDTWSSRPSTIDVTQPSYHCELTSLDDQGYEEGTSCSLTPVDGGPTMVNATLRAQYSYGDYNWYDDQPTSVIELSQRGVCQPEADSTYQWGFASVLLLAFLVATFIFAFTLYIVWCG